MPKTTNLKSIEEGWQPIADCLAKLNAPAAHITLMRYCFTAGVSFMIGETTALGQSDVTDAEAIAHYDALQSEIIEDVLKGQALLRNLQEQKH